MSNFSSSFKNVFNRDSNIFLGKYLSLAAKTDKSKLKYAKSES